MATRESKQQFTMAGNGGAVVRGTWSADYRVWQLVLRSRLGGPVVIEAEETDRESAEGTARAMLRSFFGQVAQPLPHQDMGRGLVRGLVPSAVRLPTRAHDGAHYRAPGIIRRY